MPTPFTTPMTKILTSGTAFTGQTLQLEPLTSILATNGISKFHFPDRPSPLPPAPPPPTPPPVLQPLPVTVLPMAPSDNPFDRLPFPSPGDRIRADDFKMLSQALKVIADMTSLSASLFGMTFGEAKVTLIGHGYQLARVMSVFGTEISDLADPALDARKVVQVVPAELGHHLLTVVVTEAVDTRRFVPNLMGLTYPEAQERVRSLVGEIPSGAGAPTVPQLVGLGLSEAQQTLAK